MPRRRRRAFVSPRHRTVKNKLTGHSSPTPRVGSSRAALPCGNYGGNVCPENHQPSIGRGGSCTCTSLYNRPAEDRLK